MSRHHRLVPSIAAALAAAALLAPVAQARPIAVSGAAGGSASVARGIVHDSPLANPVSAPATGLNHGAGVALDRTQPIRVASSDGTKWFDVFMGATASALVIAMCAAGVAFSRRGNLAT